MNRIFINIVAFLCIIFLVWIGLNLNSQNISNENVEEIYVTNYVLESIINIITDNTLEVHEAYDFNKDIHSESSLTSKEMQEILEADYLFCISSKYEPYLLTLEESVNSGESNLKIIKMEDYVGGGNLADEHIWISPKEGLKITKAIYENLPKTKENRSLYEKNYNNLISELKIIDQKYKEFASKNKKTIYVKHDAYYWLREDYGMKIEGISGPTHDSEPSPKQLEKVIETIRSEKVNTIYNENGEEADDNIKMIQNETGVNIESLNDMEIKSNVTYLQCLEQNLEAMKRV